MDWTYEETKSVWQEAETLDFKAAWKSDNIMGHSPYIPIDLRLYEPFVLLSALAEVTKKIRLGTLATPAIRRPPPLIAKMVASIDDISGGRMNLGIGTGDDPVQSRAWGQPFPPAAELVEILRESIEIQKQMWTQRIASYKGKHFQIENTALNPKPVQKPHPPIWIAMRTGTKLMPRLAAEHADGVAVQNGDDTRVEKIINSLKTNCIKLDRDISDIKKARCVWIAFTDGTIEYETVVEKVYDILGFKRMERFFDVVGCFVYGTPTQVAEMIRRRVVDLGFEHVVATPFSVGLDVDTGGLKGSAGNFIGALRYLAKELVPKFN
jgi:alkanesulfonate monooxygenase SsuD/methylene tetrahydromethanopterin reductase-like flavin-dependent oxidoreductase (luciferase family)